MILGESAGVAASIALKEKIDVQEVSYVKLKQKLSSLYQILERPDLKNINKN